MILIGIMIKKGKDLLKNQLIMKEKEGMTKIRKIIMQWSRSVLLSERDLAKIIGTNAKIRKTSLKATKGNADFQSKKYNNIYNQSNIKILGRKHRKNRKTRF